MQKYTLELMPRRKVNQPHAGSSPTFCTLISCLYEARKCHIAKMYRTLLAWMFSYIDKLPSSMVSWEIDINIESLLDMFWQGFLFLRK